MDWNEPSDNGPLFAQVNKPIRSVHPNSPLSLADAVASGLITGRRGEVIEVVRTYGPVTDRQVKEILRLKDMNQVRPWITRCVQGRVFEELPDPVVDHETGKKVRQVKVVDGLAVGSGQLAVGNGEQRKATT